MHLNQVSIENKPEIAAKLPNSPGCYLFYNKHDDIIYIGKAKVLRKRVQQYFSNSPQTGKLKQLCQEIFYVSFIVTETEVDALLLECHLIKEHKPRYNSQLKRKKHYPYLRISINDAYPTISSTYENDEVDCEYIGCFHNEHDINNTIYLLNEIWQTPLCQQKTFKNHRPCLNAHLGKCCAPCNKSIASNDYITKIKQIVEIFNHPLQSKIITSLQRQMLKHSKNSEFELAARIRDQLSHIEKLRNKSKRLKTNLNNREVMVFLRSYHEPSIYLFFIENYKTMLKVCYSSFEELKLDSLLTVIECLKQKDFQPLNDEQLTTCIQEIGAEKLFIPIDLKKRSINISHYVLGEISVFHNQAE